MALVPRNSKQVPQYVNNSLTGLTISNNTTDANNDLDITAGVCSDSTNAYNIRLLSTLVKRLDATWVAGTNQGGLDTGAKAASTTYHVHAIYNATTVTSDVLFSTSATAPLLPSGYTVFRRVGSIMTDGSSNILAFIQDGDSFKWVNVQSGNFQSNIAPFADNSTINVSFIPTGVRVRMMGHLWVGPKNNQSTAFAWIGTFGQNKPGADSTNVGANNERTDIMASSAHTSGEASANWHQNATYFEATTNTSAQLTMSISTSIGGNVDIRIRTIGWIDGRGKTS